MTSALLTQTFISLALISLGDALLSVRGGLRYLTLFRKAKDREPEDYAPPATLILPFRGLDPGLEDNLRAFLALEYPDLQIVLVTDTRDDPCVPVLTRLCDSHPGVEAKVVYAGLASDRGQKIHNLLHALHHLRDRDQVIAFGDSDIRPSSQWLRYLIAGLKDAQVGVSTGFRWYVPLRQHFASVMRSVWNAAVATLMGGSKVPFAWGGAMAIRRDTFTACRVIDYWKHALADDFAITLAVKDHGRSVRFEPHCLSFSHEDCTLRQLLEWSFRQLTITRVYDPKLWGFGLVSELLSNVIFWGGVVIVFVSVTRGQGWDPSLVILASLLVSVFATRGAKGWFRLRAVGVLFPVERRRLRGAEAAYLTWGPLISLLSLMGMFRAAVHREIEWRGIRYRMVSPVETVVIDDSR